MKKQIIFHPFIFALYPLVFLYLTNLDQVFWRDVVGVLAVVTVAVPLIWAINQRLFHSLHKSALITSALFLLFFSFGHLSQAARTRFNNERLAAFLETRSAQWGLIAVWLAVMGLIILLTYYARSDFKLVTQFMHVVSIGLAAFALYQAGMQIWRGQQVRQQLDRGEYFQLELEQTIADDQRAPQTAPDIYYIILDGFGRSDILQELYDYDNRAWLDLLRDDGFYIAQSSTSNYPMTVQSLSSSFNFAYLDIVKEKYPNLTDDFNPLMFMLIQNRLQRQLKMAGYEMVVFDSGFPVTEVLPADIRMGPQVSLNAFQNQVINLTPLRIFLVDMQYNLHRERIQYAFENMPAAGNADKPRFIFAHILVPHPPFVFQTDGSPTPIDKDFSIIDSGDYIGQEEYVQRYRAQVTFTSQLVAEMLHAMRSQDGRPAIILMQGDHGPGSQLRWDSLEATNLPERFSIFNAYYFPDGDYSQLYPQISPVNSFRVILNQYFGTDYPLLEDRSYFALLATPYKWFDVTESVRSAP